MTTLKAARAALAAQITTATAAYSPTVLAYDPPTIGGNTITVATAGVTPTDWLLTVRIYVPAVQSSQGQDLLDDLVTAVDTVAENTAVTPRGDWNFAYDEGKDCFLMLATVPFPREDF